MNKLISIGIDVGSSNGAIAIVDNNLNIIYLAKVPTYQTELKYKRNKSKLNKETGKYEVDFRKRTWVDFKAFREILNPYIKNKIIYTIEKISPRPGESEAPSFMNGNALGIFQGLYAYLNPIDFYNPTPIEWKKDIGVTSDKDTSKKLAEEVFQITLKDYLKKGKTDDIAEALLLSFYGLRQYYIKKGEI